jgi:ABC-type lipoprotein export system ATPase subunit
MFKRLNDEGTTIVQVTHSETNAAYGNRIIQLEDGWIVNPVQEQKTGAMSY